MTKVTGWTWFALSLLALWTVGREGRGDGRIEDYKRHKQYETWSRDVIQLLKIESHSGRGLELRVARLGS
ncbi:MAG: hypothetical protein GX748_04575 [Lentisphaerae bacterium]|nr:hypothetical protein [Lentisphaerota bacterium]